MLCREPVAQWCRPGGSADDAEGGVGDREIRARLKRIRWDQKRGKAEAHLVVLKRRNDTLAFPELDLSILQQSRDGASRWAENIEP